MRLDRRDFKNFTGKFYGKTDNDWTIDHIGHKPGMHFEQVKNLKHAAFVYLSEQRRKQLNAKSLPTSFDLAEWLPNHPEVKVVITEKPIKSMENVVPQFIVPNAWRFYREVAAYIRKRYENPMIVVTGSVGKTTTRLMVTHLIRASHRAVITNRGNDNVRIVLPQLLTSAMRVPDAMVAELSIGTLKVAKMDGNEDRPMSELYRATTAIITQIGGAHASSQKGKDPREATAERKSHIFWEMDPQGQAVLNYDMEPKILKYLQHEAYKHVEHVYTFSQYDRHADAYIIERRDHRDYSEFDMQIMDEVQTVRLGMPGDGPIMDLLAACLAYKLQGWKLPNLTDAFSDFKQLNRELTFHEMDTNQGKSTLVDDTYNSTKYSVENVLSVFKTRGEFYQGLKVLVIETGDDITDKQAEKLNLSYREKILDSGIDIVIGYRDPTIKPLIDSLQGEVVDASYYPDMDPIADYVKTLPADSLIIIKGQHWKYGSDLRLLAPKLLNVKPEVVS